MALLRFNGDPVTALLGLQSELERFMGNPTFVGTGLSGGGAYPPVNIFESDTGAVVVAEVPGLDASRIGVAGKGRTLTISGEREFKAGSGGWGYHRRELTEGWFSRSIQLSEDYDVQKAEANYEAGLLVVRIPRAERSIPRQITVQSA